MFRKVASKAGLVGFALVCGAALAACASSDDSAGSTPSGGGSSSNSAGTGSSAAGASNNTGGSFSSSAGASNSTGGSTAIAGATSSGAGASAGGASSTGPFTCAGVMANCDSWTTFPQSTTNSWGSGMFTGGITVYGAGLTRVADGTDSIHITGMVTGYGYGFGLYFSTCSNLSKYTGVSYKVKGNAATTSAILQVPTNVDYPWQPMPTLMKGACSVPDASMATSLCLAPNKSEPVTMTETTVTVAFTDLAGGMPTTTADPTQVLGIQWALPWMPPATAYAADITVSDITLIGGTGVSCAGVTAGTGGAGGSAGAATAGAGGAAAGSGGTGGA